MARLIKAVARCGLRFESGLPLGRVQRKGSAAARSERKMKQERKRQRKGKRYRVVVVQRG